MKTIYAVAYMTEAQSVGAGAVSMPEGKGGTPAVEPCFPVVNAETGEAEMVVAECWEDTATNGAWVSYEDFGVQVRRTLELEEECDRWHGCAVYLDYRGADYCVMIHKELDAMQAEHAEHRKQTLRILARAEAAEEKCRAMQDKITNRDAQLVTQAGAHMLAITGARCDLSAALARSARLGRKLQRVGLHLAETRKKLRKVEGERECLREKWAAAEKTIARVQADRDDLLREKAGLPAEEQAALAAMEVKP